MSDLMRCGVFLLVVVNSARVAAGPIVRVATWNVANGPHDDLKNRQAFATVLQAIGPVDVLALVETDTNSAVDTIEVLDTLYGAGPADPLPGIKSRICLRPPSCER